MRFVLLVVVWSLLLSLCCSNANSKLDPLSEWKSSVTEWPESLGKKEIYRAIER